VAKVEKLQEFKETVLTINKHIRWLHYAYLASYFEITKKFNVPLVNYYYFQRKRGRIRDETTITKSSKRGQKKQCVISLADVKYPLQRLCVM
jgi:hypothetical protein